MKTTLKNTLHFLLFFLTSLFAANAQHTFSIVAVDPATGEIGSAGATCIAAEDGARDVSVIILGKGAINTQAWWDPTNQLNGQNRMDIGDSPQEIMDWLVANDSNGNPDFRQYIAVDLNNGNPRSAYFTGDQVSDEHHQVKGANYAIAGNILISKDVITDMETAFLNTQGSLAEKLMASLQAAKRPGADSRCLNDGISSSSAYLRVAKPTDTDSSYGQLSIDFNVWVTDTPFEPIDELQQRLDQVLSTDDKLVSKYKINLFPNPSNDHLTITSQIPITYFEITDTMGKTIVKKGDIALNQSSANISTHHLSKGLYFIKIYTSETPEGIAKRFLKK